MKQLRVWGSTAGRAFAALCLFILVATSAPAATNAGEKANALYINGPQWPVTRLRVHALEPDTKLRVSDQGSLSGYNRELPLHGVTIEDNFHPPMLRDDGYTLAGTVVGVAQLPVTAGRAEFSTEALFRDAQNQINVVDIPALSAPLPQSASESCGVNYSFYGVENGYEAKSTFLAIIPERSNDTSSAELLISVRDERNDEIATERVRADGFVYYELATAIRAGNLTITSLPARIGPALPAARVWIVAFVGYRNGGGPRVVLPVLSAHCAAASSEAR